MALDDEGMDKPWLQGWLAQVGVPAYGLDSSFRGRRAIGDGDQARSAAVGASPQLEWEYLGLLHLHLEEPAGPSLQAISVTPDGPSGQYFLNVALREGRSDVAPHSLATQPLALHVDVDGQSLSFEGVQAGRIWAAEAAVGAVRLVLVGVDWPWSDISLVRIHDLAPYQSGREEWLKAIRDH